MLMRLIRYGLMLYIAVHLFGCGSESQNDHTYIASMTMEEDESICRTFRLRYDWKSHCDKIELSCCKLTKLDLEEGKGKIKEDGGALIYIDQSDVGHYRKVSRILGEVLSRVVSELNVPFYYTINYSMVNVSEIPVSCDIDIEINDDDKSFTFPIFYKGSCNIEKELLNNKFFVYIYFNEMFEATLGTPRTNPFVLLDYNNVNHYTRWFREGMASYVGNYAVQKLEEIIKQDNPNLIMKHGCTQGDGVSALSILGCDVFNWTNHDDFMYSDDYYRATRAIFKLIEYEYGVKAVASIIQKVFSGRKRDGEQLKSIIHNVIGMSVDDFIKKYDVNIGLYGEGFPGDYKVVVVDNSIAYKLRFRTNDEVISINGNKEKIGLMDLEIAIFEYLKNDTKLEVKLNRIISDGEQVQQNNNTEN